MIDRLSKIVLTTGIACFFSLVVFNNVTDYRANFAFVQHVLLMDTVPDSALAWRAIANPTLHHITYWSIILWEAITALFCWVGLFQLSKTLTADATSFNSAKAFVVIGLTASCWLWLFAFLCIGGEWFAMWQSPVWNGQPIAFRLFVISSIVLLLIQQPEGDL